jgi:hypothetical protein
MDHVTKCLDGNVARRSIADDVLAKDTILGFPPPFLPNLLMCGAFIVELITPNGVVDGCLHVAAVLGRVGVATGSIGLAVIVVWSKPRAQLGRKCMRVTDTRSPRLGEPTDRPGRVTRSSRRGVQMPGRGSLVL